MGNFIVAYRLDRGKDNRPIDTYAGSFAYWLKEAGHDVLEIGEGHPISKLDQVVGMSSFDYFIDLDCGRNKEGKLHFIHQYEKSKIPSIVWFVDSHGYPTEHRRLSKTYNHVFFAVWRRRDLFTNHSSVHWMPNATDARWFNYEGITPECSFGFFGSRHGLDRADPMKQICEEFGWTYDIRELSKPFTHKFPKCGIAMNACLFLFNKGQKHDGPNLRVIESMAVGRPLITDMDPSDGMDQLFEEGKDYLGYSTYEELKEKMQSLMFSPDRGTKMAHSAFTKVHNNHLVKHRVAQMLEVIK